MKKRLDILLLERGLAPSRTIAQSLIMRGDVLVSDRPENKPGTLISEDAELRLRGELPRFVGRGGEKIDPIFAHFGIDLVGVVAVDIGASTGGFTDAMLQRGAKFVYAIDVGTNQLDYRLRTDARVHVMEQTNAKDLSPAMFPEPPTFGSIDVSFIGLRKILDPVLAILSPPRALVMLVKPQFELGPEFVEKGGVVSSEVHQLRAVDEVSAFLTSRGQEIVGVLPSPLRGSKKGNQEYFLYSRARTTP